MDESDSPDAQLVLQLPAARDVERAARLLIARRGRHALEFAKRLERQSVVPVFARAVTRCLQRLLTSQVGRSDGRLFRATQVGGPTGRPIHKPFRT